MKLIGLDTQNLNHPQRLKLGRSSRQPTTKLILKNYSGNFLNIPNGKEKILDRLKNYPLRLKDSPNQ